MKVAILGSGSVGQVLGLGFVAKGHDVVIGSRNPDSETLCAWLSRVGDSSRSASYAEAAAWSEVAVFVPTWLHAEAVAEAVGADALAGKVVIDVTNPFGTLPDGTTGLVLPPTDGAGSHLQRWLPEAHVVKAFNTVGVSLMVDPQLPGGPPTMPICGDDADAKAVVSKILLSFGWEPMDLGGIEFSGYLEALTMVWMRYGRVTGNWNHAFKMLAG